MLRPLTACFTSLVLLGTTLLRGAEPPPHRSLSGEIEGAHWAALVPEHWDGRLLLVAPDCRQPPEPLAITLAAADRGNAELLGAGWALATTGYRRHGPLVADGIADLRALRDRLVEELGQPKLTLVDGIGMGGLIATFIAERHADEFHGCIARDPLLDLRDPRALRLRCDHQPRAPLLFVASSRAIAPAQGYIDRARTAANAESVVPVFWFDPVDPAPEDQAALRLAALAAMEEWVRTGHPPDTRPEPPPEPEPDTSGPANHDEVPAGGISIEAPIPETSTTATTQPPSASTPPAPEIAP